MVAILSEGMAPNLKYQKAFEMVRYNGLLVSRLTLCWADGSPSFCRIGKDFHNYKYNLNAGDVSVLGRAFMRFIKAQF